MSRTTRKPAKATLRHVEAYFDAREAFDAEWQEASKGLRQALFAAGYRIDRLVPPGTLLSLARYSEDSFVAASLLYAERRLFEPTQALVRAMARVPESDRRIYALPQHGAMIAHFDHYTKRPVTPRNMGAVLAWTSDLVAAMRERLRREG